MRLQELEQALVNAHKSGDVEGAKVLANAVVGKRKSMGMMGDGSWDVPDPAATGSPFLAGVGKAMTDIVQGIQQKIPGVNVTEADVREKRRLDAPLMQTTSGKAGNIVGTAALLAPTAMIPGANTLAGAAGIGAVTGALMPAESVGEWAKNTALGGVLSPASIVGGRAIGAGYQGVKGLVQPFFKSGQESIAAKTLQSFAGNPRQAAYEIQAGKELVPGSMPTAAELTKDAGIAQLQRSIQNADPQVASAFTARGLANNEARSTALGQIAGDESQREFWKMMRETVANKLYGRAFNKPIDAKQWEKFSPRVEELMKRPSMQEAQQRALKIAQEEGIDLTKDGSVRGLHYMKKALDDMLDAAPQSGVGNVTRRAVADTRDELIGVIDKLSKPYAKARAEYAEMSKKIAQMEVGQSLKDKAFPALTDFGGLTRTRSGAYADAVRNADALIKRITGFKGSTLENTMDAAQIGTIKNVAADLARKVNSEELGRAVGSNTAQNLVSQNVLRQALGPTGLPQSWAESTLLQTLLRPAQFAAKAGEAKVTPLIGNALLNPEETVRLLLKAQQKGLLERGGAVAEYYLPSLGLLGLPTN